MTISAANVSLGAMPGPAKVIKSGMLQRSMEIDRAEMKDDRTVTLSFSSETPIERWFGFETLDHSPEAVDLTRLRNGGALLVEHDPRDQIGVIESADVGSDRRGHAVVRFGTSARAQEIYSDVVNKIRRLVSVGYRIRKMQLEGEDDGVARYRATSWVPLELSIVAVPADATVGIGRSSDNTDAQEITITYTDNMKILLEHGAGGGGGTATASSSAAATTPPATPPVARGEGDILSGERTRVREINAIADRLKTDSARALAKQAIASGMSLDAFRADILNREFIAQPVVTNPEIGMTRKEVERFSLLAAIRSLARNRPLEGLEKEACEAAQKHLRRELKTANSFVVPEEVSRYHDELVLSNTRAQNVTTAAAGGYTVQTQVGPLIELLRNKTVLGRMGITIIDGVQGDFVMPVQNGGATAYWVSETGTITDSEATFGQKVMVPHRLGASLPFTMQFLAQSSISADAFVRGELDTVLALKKDLAGLLGTGVSGEPIGVANTTGINATVTYGGAATWADIVEHETGINIDNADIGSMGFIIDAATCGKWKTILKDSVAGAGYLLSDNMTANGYPVERTQQIVAAHQSFFGVWSQLMLVQWAGREITVDNITLAKSGQHQIIMNEMCDFLVRQPLAFNVSTDSAAQ